MVFYYIIVFLLVLLILKCIYNWVRLVILRTVFCINLKRVCKKRGYGLKMPRFIFASFFRYSKKPDAVIMTGGTDYLVRMITCRARKRNYHFVDHEWFVRSMKLYMLLPFLEAEPIVLFRRAFYLPPLDEKYLRDGESIKRQVLLFNPSPIDITFTTRENRRAIGANGVDFDGWLICNGKGLIGELGRESGG